MPAFAGRLSGAAYGIGVTAADWCSVRSLG
jgi:hypothetical protein